MSWQVMRFFCSPESYVLQAAPSDWTTLLSECRKHGLLAKGWFVLADKQLDLVVPFAVSRQFASGAKYAAKQQQTLFYELKQLESMLQRLNGPCLLLKGAAYRSLGLRVSRGRLFSDIDLLVAEDNFNEFKNALFFQGFYESEIAEYDRQYYLRWSHQNPPLQHFERDTVIDLHHHIFPVSSAEQLNIAPIFEKAQSINGSSFKVPCLEHLFIHAAVHLFWQEESHRSVKDIIDLNQLVDDFAVPDRLLSLSAEARTIGASDAVSNVMYVLVQVFGSEVASQYLALTGAAAPKRFVCWCFIQTLQSKSFISTLCRCLWFIRGHSLKMRWHILLYHAVAKPASGLRQLWRSKLKPR